MTRVLKKKKKKIEKIKKYKRIQAKRSPRREEGCPAAYLAPRAPGAPPGAGGGIPQCCSGFPGHCAAAKATARRLFWSLLPGEGFALHSRLHITAPPGTERAGVGKTTAKASPSYPPETRSRRASGAASCWGRRAERGEREGSGAGGREKPSPRCPRPAVIPGCMRAAGCRRPPVSAAVRDGDEAGGALPLPAGAREETPDPSDPPFPPGPATRTPPRYGTGKGSRARTARGSPRAGGVCATHVHVHTQSPALTAGRGCAREAQSPAQLGMHAALPPPSRNTEPTRYAHTLLPPLPSPTENQHPAHCVWLTAPACPRCVLA